jgi:hypothetical protein
MFIILVFAAFLFGAAFSNNPDVKTVRRLKISAACVGALLLMSSGITATEAPRGQFPPLVARVPGLGLRSWSSRLD